MTANKQSENREKKWIRPLPERLINKIAAGEVIERPAAVLKELLENSLDAGATRIDITVEKSGLKSITIVDDGCGIDAEQIEIAFSRHATSKIRDFDDLESLLSFGFRGEALPSIGSVSKTRMVSRTSEADDARELIIEGGVLQSVKPIASPVGTKIEVNDLFYNTPARRKFLKSEITEARHLTRTATAMALSVPGIRFSYTLNGRRLFLLSKNADKMQIRVGELLFGKENTPLLEIKYNSDKLNISGHLSFPDNCRRNRNGLYMYINRRYIFSPTLLHAITAGYGELLPRGFYPVGALFLDIDPKRVDVNVHPTKAEVRLVEERQVHDLLYHVIKKSLRASIGLPSASSVVQIKKSEDNYTAAEAIRRLKDFMPDKTAGNSPDMLEKLYGQPKPDESNSIPISNSQTPESDLRDIETSADVTIKPDPSTETIRYLGQLSRLYLVFATGDELLIVDQHTAHERVLYEENLKAIENGKAVSQNLLFPINIELTAERFAVYEEAADILKSAGIISQPFGSTTVMLSAVSASLTKKSPEKIFDEILTDVENLHKGGEELTKAVAQSMACRAAIMSGDIITPDEALGLYKRLVKVENKYCCPHGRPVTLKLSKDELDKKFGR
ncbi:MAG: DNA mismatch repair endonuclease MutL [candidate division Zixibacteria bacterium]|nr:DNA mismatch repair endonuclease MutL [candidate division Zixibacteria bacterium]